MEKKIIVISNRFRNNTLHKYEYISAQFSVKTADMFLKRLKNRIDFIAEHPEAGKASVKRKNIRSLLLTPHNQIFYRYKNDTIVILFLFDMRKNPDKNPY